MAGKIYYELLKERQARSLDNEVAFIRLEELAPFPFPELRAVLQDYTAVEQVMWLQEEPRNQGAYAHVASRIDVVLQELGLGRLVYKGRKESAVPAPGIGRIYGVQQQEVIQSAFKGL